MNIRTHPFVLLGVLAASAAVPADITPSHSGNAQAQAASLLRTDRVQAWRHRPEPNVIHAASSAPRIDVQLQAADVLRGHLSASSAPGRDRGAAKRGAWVTLEEGDAPGDAQSRARHLLRAEGPQRHETIEAKKLAGSR